MEIKKNPVEVLEEEIEDTSIGRFEDLANPMFIQQKDRENGKRKLLKTQNKKISLN